MTKIQIVYELLHRINQEEEAKRSYNHDMDLAKLEAKKQGKSYGYWEYMK